MQKYLIVLVALLAAGTAQAQDTKASANLAVAKVFAFQDMPVTHSANGAERRQVVANGTLATGEALEIHQSLQPANLVAGRPHVIGHSEIILVQEGTLALEHDGKSESAGPGSVIYIALGTNHLIRNIGGTPARYTVIAIGGDAK